MGVVGVVQSTTFEIIFSIKSTNFQNLMFKGKILVGAPLDQTLDFRFILTLTLSNHGFSKWCYYKYIDHAFLHTMFMEQPPRFK